MNDIVFKGQNDQVLTSSTTPNGRYATPEALFIGFNGITNWLKSIKSNKKISSTYLMLDKGSGLYKIGKAQDILKRFKSIRRMCPMLHFIGSCNSNIEHKLHENFEANRVNGEWFRLTKSDVEFILNEFKNNMKPIIIKTGDGASISISKAEVYINDKPSTPEVGLSFMDGTKEIAISLTTKDAALVATSISSIIHHLKGEL